MIETYKAWSIRWRWNSDASRRFFIGRYWMSGSPPHAQEGYVHCAFKTRSKALHALAEMKSSLSLGRGVVVRVLITIKEAR